MGSAQSSLSSFIFPEMSDSELKNFLNCLNCDGMSLKFERTLGKGRVSWSMLVRASPSKSLLLLRLYAKKSSPKSSIGNSRRNSISIDPLSATKLSFIHELYYEKCSQFDFVLKPLFIIDDDNFLVLIRPFARFNLPDRLLTESLSFQDKLWIAQQLIEAFLKLHSLRAFHGDFGSGKIFLTSTNKILIGDFAPVKPFCLQNRIQTPIEFYQIWFDEGLEGEFSEIGRGCYLAPERLKFNSVENFEASDLFSLGCVLVELFSSRAFLQFKDVLLLSNATSDEEYNQSFDRFLKNNEIKCPEIIQTVLKLCSRDHSQRKLSISDLELIKSLIDPNISTWRWLLSSYRFNNNYNSKKEIISKISENYLDGDNNILLICLKEKDMILAGLIANCILRNCRTNRDNYFNLLINTLYDNFESNQFVTSVIKDFLSESEHDNCAFINQFPLINAFNSGIRENILKFITEECDLNEIIQLASKRLSGDKLMGIMNKLLQIYRKRDIYDPNFEASITFEYLKINADKEELTVLYKTCCKFHEKLKISEPVNRARIAFQLDLEKNKVPIESLTGLKRSKSKIKSRSSWILSRSQSQNVKVNETVLAFPKLKQRAFLQEPIIMTESLKGIIQSTHRTFLVGYTDSTLLFWDLKQISIKSAPNREPLARVDPRVDAVITSIIFGSDSNSLLISFKDGIIGLYKLSGPADEFSIIESFGPFESCDGLQLLMTRTFYRMSVLLVIGTERIFGISPINGEIYFEFFPDKLGIGHVLDLVDGCLMCLNSSGQFRLIEIFYETGQILGAWQLEYSSPSEAWEIQAASIISDGDKIKLSVNLFNCSKSNMILFFEFDPLCDNIPCSFRYLKLSSDFDYELIPIINLKRIRKDREKVVSCKKYQYKSLVCLNEEIVDCSDGILRVIDFKNLNQSNSTSILYPASYKPALKLRSKKDQIPEIVESLSENSKNSPINGIIEKLSTIDGKNILLLSLINDRVMFYY